jgi:putative ABC transport system permease protein
MFLDYLRLSVNNLTRRKLRSWLTMIGIFIGIAAVVALIGLGEGLRSAISSQFDMLSPDIITIQAGGLAAFGPPGSTVSTPLSNDLVKELEKISDAEYVISRSISSGYAKFNDRIAIGMAGSMPNGDKRAIVEDMVGIEAEFGRLLKDGDQYKIVVGNNFMKDDIFGKPVQVGNRIMIQDKYFEVVGIAKKLGNFMLDGVVLMNEDVQKELFNEGDDVSLIVVKARKNVNMELLKESIEKVMRKERDVKVGKEDFSVELAINTLETLNSTLFAVQLFVYIIASISLIVGGIGITNTMYTSVLEKTKDIGVMKAIGAKNRDIFVLFLLESGLLGMAGGLIGIIVGVAMAKGMAFIGSMQLGSDLIRADISFALAFGSLAFSFIIGCVAGITPAIRAAKMHPVDALRFAK